MVSIHMWPFDTCEYILNIFQIQIRIESLSQKLLTSMIQFHLTVWLSDWFLDSVDVQLFLCSPPGFRVLCCKVKTQHVEVVTIPPHAPACGCNQFAHAPHGAQSCFSWAHWYVFDTWAVTMEAQKGLLTPSFLWKDASAWQLPTWQVTFWKGLEELILK